MVRLDSQGKIIHESRQVGRLIYDENHIKKIEIYHSKQNQGYGTEAIQQYLNRMESQGYIRITTSPATSPVIEHIFKKLGFRRVEDPSGNSSLDGAEKLYKMRFIKEFDPE